MKGNLRQRRRLNQFFNFPPSYERNFLVENLLSVSDSSNFLFLRFDLFLIVVQIVVTVAVDVETN